MNQAVDQRIPRRLKKEPLLEAVWELRFQSGTDMIEHLLSGIIFDKMAGQFAMPVRLAAADIPTAARVQQPILNYTPIFRFDGNNENRSYGIQISPRAVTLNCRKPYVGWKNFKLGIIKLAEVVRHSGLIGQIERFSLKYVDLIPSGGPDCLAPIDCALRLGPYNLGLSPLHLQSQIPDGDFVHVVTMLAPARVQMEQETFDGLVVDIDTIFPAGGGNFWDEFSSRLDQAHASNHSIFFDILKQETINLLGPEYDEGDVKP